MGEVEQHKTECLYRYMKETTKENRERFFLMYEKIHGAVKLDELKQNAREFFKK
jgi:Ca2+-binding EF-hand superfamily protein